MALHSSIEWTETTWNPVTGCTPISDGCRNCYAARLAKRLKAMGNDRYRNGFQLTLHHDLIDIPLHWIKPRLVFVNSMSDLFHEDIPVEFIQKIFSTMKQGKQHTFQILTKRSTRLMEIAPKLTWPDNVWMGVTIESGKYAYRANNLRKTPAAVRFISVEPMVGPANNVDFSKIDWVIVGGESGPKSRKVEESWVKAIRDECVFSSVPFFFKQWGGTNKKKAGRLLEGKTWDQYPRLYNGPQQCRNVL